MTGAPMNRTPLTRTSMTDLLVVGGDSLVGSACAARLSRSGLTVHATTRRAETAGPGRPFVDLRAQRWEAIEAEEYRTAVLAAAVARVADCRRDPEGSAAVNLAGTLALARRLAERGTRVLFLSTNHVFDGSKPLRSAEETPCPVSEYGRQKAAAEAGILALPKAGVLRLTKVVHPGLPLFDGWAASLRAGAPITPFGDFGIAPVTLDLVADCVEGLVRAEHLDGIWQLSAPADLTYAEVAAHIAAALGSDPALVRPLYGEAHKALGGEAPPRWSALDSSRVARSLGLVPPGTLAAVESCLPDIRFDRTA
ncbi:sugar nucleotide-binding protein [Azospirillum sp. SYSU D00513]|uniref:sugar nucleotide-binding protein n=1 Tax=Azospirillum sp. SYSU D00513 TaxID=2812561 RepID=UPI001A961204|nr:sugar nucleotide-binding protein [Azospirillum sp. SYSU D00513]